MAGVHFDFVDFKKLIDLNIGIADRLDENRAESFTILYCNFSDMGKDVIKNSLENVLRSSDAISSHKKDYFFVLPYTDKFGANIVKKMFDDFFAKEIKSFVIAYPKDGETTESLVQELQNQISTQLGYDLKYLD